MSNVCDDGRPASKDNKLLAVIAMNIAAFSATGTTAVYRSIAEEFHAAEFCLFRNTISFIVTCFWCLWSGYNPRTQFPMRGKCALATRILAG